MQVLTAYLPRTYRVLTAYSKLKSNFARPFFEPDLDWKALKTKDASAIITLLHSGGDVADLKMKDVSTKTTQLYPLETESIVKV